MYCILTNRTDFFANVFAVIVLQSIELLQLKLTHESTLLNWLTFSISVWRCISTKCRNHDTLLSFGVVSVEYNLSVSALAYRYSAFCSTTSFSDKFLALFLFSRPHACSWPATDADNIADLENVLIITGIPTKLSTKCWIRTTITLFCRSPEIKGRVESLPKICFDLISVRKGKIFLD